MRLDHLLSKEQLGARVIVVVLLREGGRPERVVAWGLGPRPSPNAWGVGLKGGTLTSWCRPRAGALVQPSHALCLQGVGARLVLRGGRCVGWAPLGWGEAGTGGRGGTETEARCWVLRDQTMSTAPRAPRECGVGVAVVCLAPCGSTPNAGLLGGPSPHRTAGTAARPGPLGWWGVAGRRWVWWRGRP